MHACQGLTRVLVLKIKMCLKDLQDGMVHYSASCGVLVRRHVHDGIRVPLEIRHDLVENVVPRRHTVYSSVIDTSDL